VTSGDVQTAPSAAERAEESEMSGTKGNRLALEKSPYLLQHADNPVDWYPWGDEAFEAAARQDKPIFLSIGYSTCHWCHVMEHESFEDAEVAALMNEAFINIKVDREERPDIDGVYMAVAQMLTGSGGWPLTIIMTPDKRPFFAATYIPKESRFGRAGMLELIPRTQELWATRRDDVLASAGQITAALRQASAGTAGEELGKAALDLAFEQLAARYDGEHGGFGTAPKFPTPHNYLFLLRYWRSTGNEQALEIVRESLSAMARGGIHDQIGFGFHRYSTDQQWLVPHFEKMLYDQALLAIAYTETYQATGEEVYGRTARQILDYVLRDMTGPRGGFYSAEDADSEGEEGKFYLWTRAEIEEVLTAEEAELAIRVFNIEEGGNYLDQLSGEKTGDNILYLGNDDDSGSGPETAADDIEEGLDTIRRKLFEHREKRVHPHKDDKVLTDWNGLMIAAFAKASREFHEPVYEVAAGRALDFILSEMVTSEGLLLHRYRQGEAAVPAHLDDYAFLIHGILELYETSLDPALLERALELNGQLTERFWDEVDGGFYFTADDAEELLVRTREIYDGAVPSGNSLAALNLLRLGRITADDRLEERAAAVLRAFSGQVGEQPIAHTQLMVAVDFAIGPSYEVVIAGDPRSADTGEMLAALGASFVPNKVVVLRPPDPQATAIIRLAPYTEYYRRVDDRATAYICQDYNCELPTTSIARMLELLGVKQ
jgi:uncharacterized protein YyaL (SSP411 family)